MRATQPPDRPRHLLLVVVIVGLLVAACGNADDDGGSSSGTTAASAQPSGDVPGVTDDEIRFSAFGTISNNPLGTCVLECYAQGIEAYFAYRNSEGGVHGRDLVLSTVLDDELTKNQERALEIVSAGDTFAAFSAAQIPAGWPEITKAGMPLYVWNIHPNESADEAIYGNPQAPPCLSCVKRLDAYAAKLAGAEKVAVVGYGVSESSKLAAQATRDSIEEYSDDIGGPEVVYFNDGLAFGLPNGVGPEVTAMEQADVDMVFASVDLNGMKTLAQELERQGMGDVPMFHPNTYDQAFVEEAGDLFEGDYVFTSFRPFEADSGDSDLDLFKEWMEEQDFELSELALYGWISAVTAYEGIEAAGPGFDQAKVIAASNEQLTEFTANGLIPPIDYSTQHVVPTPEDVTEIGPDPYCGVILQVTDGEFEVIGDPEEPWSCWPGDTLDWSEPEPTTFD